MNNFSGRLKKFAFQNLSLESDLSNIEKNGIDIGHLSTIKTDEIVDIERFDKDIVKQARKMADFYVLYYSFENTIRRLISETLSDKYGDNWWDQQVPEDVKINVKKNREKENDTTMTIRSSDPLYYTNFGELIDIVNHNWLVFSGLIRSKKAMESTLSQFGHIRNVIAHSCELMDDDIKRAELSIKDWFRIQL